MKRIFLAITLLFAAFIFAYAENNEVLKIGTFNLRMDTPSDGDDSWSH